jgi:hypothetical protein
MVRWMIAVLCLLAVAVAAICLNLPCQTCEREIWPETLSEAEQCGFDYCRNFHAGRAGQAGSLDNFVAFSAQTDAASALGHGCAMILVLQSAGDEAVSKAIARQTPRVRSRISSVLEVGVAYGLARPPEETCLLFPKSWKAAQADEARTVQR